MLDHTGPGRSNFVASVLGQNIVREGVQKSLSAEILAERQDYGC